jgi:hypothetical protein
VERGLLNRFLDEIEPRSTLKEQYRWFNPPNQRTDSFWYLSVMQHHGCPTRLVDFTADFWAAMFFAVDGAKNGVKPAIYRLKCKNEDADDKGGNKSPKDCDGKPWRDFRDVDINDLLGQIIEYGGFQNQQGDFWQSNP